MTTRLDIVNMYNRTDKKYNLPLENNWVEAHFSGDYPLMDKLISRIRRVALRRAQMAKILELRIAKGE